MDSCQYLSMRLSRNGVIIKDLYPDCKSVIAVGIALPKGLFRVEPRLLYGHFNTVDCNKCRSECPMRDGIL